MDPFAEIDERELPTPLARICSAIDQNTSIHNASKLNATKMPRISEHSILH